MLHRSTRLATAAAAALILAACAAGPNHAPVEERKPVPQRSVAVPTPPPAAVQAAPVVELPRAAATDNTAGPGFYTVKPGDMLVRIALEHGQNWRDLQRWNNLDNPNLIEVGQVLRISPPSTADAASAAASRPVASGGRVESRPLEAKGGAGSASSPSPIASAPAPVMSSPASAAASVPPVPTPARPAPLRDADDDLQWSWPSAGPVATGFDEGRSKGLAITGKAGDPVLAAADGRVVYAGSGLRGYGNLVIVKHNAVYLTAYAHNQTLLVKDEQVVRKGQKIAEMGSSDADRVQLHFEVRRLGVPIDPLRVLPQR